MDAVPPRERARASATLSSCPTVSLPAGSRLGGERRETISLLLVEDGLVFVSAGNRGTSRRLVLTLAGSGSVLLPPSPQQRLEALANARLTLITARAKRELLEIPVAAAVVVDGVAIGLRDCQESLTQFASLRHVDRVRQKLTQLGRIYGNANVGGLSLHLPLTHELLAEMVGSTRETVTRALSQLAQEGFVRQERGTYQLVDLPEGSAS